MQICDREMCSGCHACFNICPVRCITMCLDEEGFLYPKVDKERCIDCGLCKEVCPALKPEKKEEKLPAAYACWNKNKEIRMSSSSGGLFTAFAQEILEHNGIVYGAAFDDDFSVHHICIKSAEELRLLQGSKYVQSAIGDTYAEVKRYLQNGRTVYFSGTPCQIYGLLGYLQKPYDSLYTQDIICHGVPSVVTWKHYVAMKEKQQHAKVKTISFRNKDNGWLSYCMKFVFDNGSVYRRVHGKDLFMRGFLKNLYLRPCCYHCHYKTKDRCSDITLADFWGIEDVKPELFQKEGTSLVLIHSERGQELMERIQGKLVCQKVDAQLALDNNSSATMSIPCPKYRSEAAREAAQNGFGRDLLRYLKKTEGNPALNFVKRVLRKLKSVLSIPMKRQS